MKKILSKLINLIIKIKNRLFLNLLKNKIGNKKIVKQTKINGQAIIVPLNSGIGREICALKKYEEKNTIFLKKIVEKDWISLDIGSNIGYYSLLLSKLSPEGEIYAFDPNKNNNIFLDISIYLNDLKNITINQIALSDKNGESEFFIAEDAGFSSFHDTKRIRIEKSLKVQTLSLDNFVEKNNIKKIDFIKMDAEGAEKMILDGAKKTIELLKPKIIMAEICPENLKPFGTDGRQIIDFFNNFKYLPYILKNNRLCKLTEIENIKNIDAYFINKDYEKNIFSKLPQ
jgi:FkbM family methyltransferase